MFNEVVHYSLKSDPVADLEDKFSTLFPTWPTILATLLSLLIIMFVLGPLVYKSVKKMVARRRKYIQDNIDQAEKLNNEALLEREKASEEISQARYLAREIVANAKLTAEEIRNKNLASARDEANKIVALAKNDMKREKEIFAIESKSEIVSVALAAAEKVIEKEVDEETSSKMINDFIKNK